ncbi:protein spinster homolog 1 [Patella vulgata]|uniref:protein spinster homolog 1 n=1 Tax=Patella vulgata TaxID=6465 RepID=UPI00217F25EB|nr:protein spinster homolog 1 [Patella vulgata]
MTLEEEEPIIPPKQNIPWYKEVKCYSVYVLLILLLTYLLNQLDRYMLAITVKPMAQEIHFGDLGCMVNETYPSDVTKGASCKANTTENCALITNNGSIEHVCKWDYLGSGFQYQLVAGPIFIVIYTFMGIFIGFLADRYNRKVLLAICLMFWSAMTLLTGFIGDYWQLVVLRLGLGAGEAGCTPFAASIISDYFSENLRGSALGIYNWGIYTGYSMSYAIGNFITLANINNQGWRWTFYIAGIPGLVLGIVMLITVKEPVRGNMRATASDKQTAVTENVSTGTKILNVARPFFRPSLLLLCIAGSVRNSGGYVWAYNTQPYFNALGTSLGKTSDETSEMVGSYMSWIPLVGGSIGVFVGGFISDRVVKKRGLYARIIVLVASQVLAAPFAAGTLYFNPPWAFICQIPTYIIGEMWVGVTLAVVIELVPINARTTAVAVYLFIISNVGGNVPLIVPPLKQAFSDLGYSSIASLRAALYILYPGTYVGGSALFLLTMFVVKWDQENAQKYNAMDQTDPAFMDKVA